MFHKTLLVPFLAALRPSSWQQRTTDPSSRGIFPRADVVVNEAFSADVQSLMGVSNVKGLSLVVVRPDGAVEFGSWGNRTEDGDKVTPDVGAHTYHLRNTDSFHADTLQHRFMFQGIFECVRRSSDRRLRCWPKHDPAGSRHFILAIKAPRCPP